MPAYIIGRLQMRDPSWLVDPVTELLAVNDVAWVCNDMVGMPRVARRTARSCAYVRLLGWHGGLDDTSDVRRPQPSSRRWTTPAASTTIPSTHRSSSCVRRGPTSTWCSSKAYSDSFRARRKVTNARVATAAARTIHSTIFCGALPACNRARTLYSGFFSSWAG